MDVEKNNELMNKVNEVFEKYSLRISAILEATNWKLKTSIPTYKGVCITPRTK